MKKLFLLGCLLSFAPMTTWAATCSGGANCNACKNCKYCGHCKAGGSCSRCRPDLYPASYSAPDEEEEETEEEEEYTSDYESDESDSSSSDWDALQANRERQTRMRLENARQEAKDQALANQLDRQFRAEQRRASVQATAKARPVAPCCEEKFTGKCVAVTDGDTLQVLLQKRPIKVRLQGIDAPESGQPWGQQSKNALSKMAFGKTVTVYPTGQDRYGRTLGWVFAGSTGTNS